MPFRFALISRSRDHLAAAGETYWQHMRFAGAVAALTLAAGLACMLHAIVPGICRTAGSRTIGLVNRLLADRSSIAEVEAEAAEAVAFALMVALCAAAAVLPWLVGVPAPVALPLGLISSALPVAVLITNPDLEPESREPALH